MHWTPTTFLFAALFPLFTVAGLLAAWPRGRTFALATLGFSLLAAAVHASLSGVFVLPAEWAAIGVSAAFCSATRLTTTRVAVLATVALLIFGRILADMWWHQEERFTTLLGGCPIAFGRAWFFEGTGDTQYQFSPDLQPRDPEQKTPPALGGVQLVAIGASLEALRSDVAAEESPAIELSEESTTALRKAHDELVWGFTESAGFGFRRMTPYLPWPDVELPMECRRPDDVEMEDESAGPSPGARVSDNAGEDRTFVGPRLSDLAPKSRWVAERVQLVGLVKSREARVYEIQGAPQMGELDNVATRPLDAFEASALDLLAAGEELVTSARKDGIRMLGAIRADENCLACHAVQKGALLGAFTYHLRPAAFEKSARPVETPAFLRFRRMSIEQQDDRRGRLP